MDSPLILIDDLHVPAYRVVWVADLPHFCGDPDCEREGQYEVRLDVDESLWTNLPGRDQVLDSLRKWCGGSGDENSF